MHTRTHLSTNIHKHALSRIDLRNGRQKISEDVLLLLREQLLRCLVVRLGLTTCAATTYSTDTTTTAAAAAAAATATAARAASATAAVNTTMDCRYRQDQIVHERELPALALLLS